MWLVRRCHEMKYHGDPEQGTTNDNDDDTAKDNEGRVAPASLAVELLLHRSLIAVRGSFSCFVDRRPLALAPLPLVGLFAAAAGYQPPEPPEAVGFPSTFDYYTTFLNASCISPYEYAY
ncbi:hypothetical protein THAOC_19365, partial [Thalassiosira oceanica]